MESTPASSIVAAPSSDPQYCLARGNIPICINGGANALYRTGHPKAMGGAKKVPSFKANIAHGTQRRL